MEKSSTFTKPVALSKFDVKSVASWPGFYLSEKYDGWRLTWHNDQRAFRTRSGRSLSLPKEFYQEALDLSPDYMLDGELWSGYTESEVAQSDAREQRLVYLVFDAPTFPGRYYDRHQYLLSIFQKKDNDCASDGSTNPRIKLVTQQLYLISKSKITHISTSKSNPEAIVVSKDQIEAVVREQLEHVRRRYGEGVVVRSPLMTYTDTVSRHCMKLKPLDTTSVIVVGHHRTETSATKGVEYVSSAICLTADIEELRVTVKSINPPPVGSIIEVRHSCYTVGGLPKFPVFLGVRELHTLDPESIAKFNKIRQIMATVMTDASKTSTPISDPKPIGSTKIPRAKLKDATKASSQSLSETQIKLSLSNPRCIGIINVDDLRQAIRDKCPVVLEVGKFAVIESGPNFYKVVRPQNGAAIYCCCASWLYQKLPASERTCKHCQLFSTM